MKPKTEDVPKVLDAIADIVLAYKPKAKTGKAKKREKLAAKIVKSNKASATHFNDGPSQK